MFGNPTRSSGRFRECFAGGRFAHRWHPRQIDSRSVSMTNKTQIATWVKDYGEDSDFVSRYFAPSYGIPEDPVTGSTHCSLAPYWGERLGKTSLHARQVSQRGGHLR